MQVFHGSHSLNHLKSSLYVVFDDSVDLSTPEKAAAFLKPLNPSERFAASKGTLSISGSTNTAYLLGLEGKCTATFTPKEAVALSHVGKEKSATGKFATVTFETEVIPDIANYVARSASIGVSHSKFSGPCTFTVTYDSPIMAELIHVGHANANVINDRISQWDMFYPDGEQIKFGFRATNQHGMTISNPRLTPSIKFVSKTDPSQSTDSMFVPVIGQFDLVQSHPMYPKYLVVSHTYKATNDKGESYHPYIVYTVGRTVDSGADLYLPEMVVPNVGVEFLALQDTYLGAAQ